MSGKTKATPRARRLANEHGIDISTIEATSENGYVRQEDVQAVIDAQVGSDKPKRRTGRVPLGGHQLKMDMSHLHTPDLNHRWINDNGARLDQAKAGGYDFVNDDTGKEGTSVGTRISRVVGTKEDGSPLTAYLMAEPIEFYEEDQRAKQEEIARVNEAIRTGNIAGTVGADGRYVPEDSGRSRIKVDRS